MKAIAHPRRTNHVQKHASTENISDILDGVPAQWSNTLKQGKKVGKKVVSFAKEKPLVAIGVAAAAGLLISYFLRNRTSVVEE